ncbi:MAG: BatA domain-containing protein [Lentisphaeria bacterium]|nr:BatA domain-containing protein [Lentisphaeria bacterium]
MTFANPIFLAGLLLNLVPIAIHILGKTTGKPIPFTTVKIIPVEQPKAKEKNFHLHRRLLLLSRILFISLLSILFAGPKKVSSYETSEIKAEVFAYIDNSISVQMLSPEQIEAQVRSQLPEQLKEASIQYFVALPDSEELELVSSIGDVEFQPYEINHGKRIAKFAEYHYPNKILISDFQRSDWENVELPQEINSVQIKPTAGSFNVGILKAELIHEHNQGTSNSVKALLYNSSLQKQEVRVSVDFQGQVFSKDIELRPSQSQNIFFKDLPEGRGEVEIIVDAEDQLSFDNSMLFLIEPIQSHKILILSEGTEKQLKNLYLTRALQAIRIDRMSCEVEVASIHALSDLDLDAFDILCINASLVKLSTADKEKLKTFQQNQTKSTILIMNESFEAAMEIFQLPSLGLNFNGIATYPPGQSTLVSPNWQGPKETLEVNQLDLFYVDFYRYGQLKTNNSNQIHFMLENQFPLVIQINGEKASMLILNTSLDTAWSELGRSNTLVPLFQNALQRWLDPNLIEKQTSKWLKPFDKPHFKLESNRNAAYNYTRKESKLIFINPKISKTLSEQGPLQQHLDYSIIRLLMYILVALLPMMLYLEIKN